MSSTNSPRTIEFIHSSSYHNTFEGLLRSAPHLYQHVQPPTYRKFISGPARDGEDLVFAKRIDDPRWRAQLNREARAAEQLQQFPGWDTIVPRLRAVHDEPLTLIYEVLDGYEPLSPPFLPESREAASIPVVHTLIDSIERFQNLADDHNKLDPNFMELGGYRADGSHTTPESIKGLSGMNTLVYLEQLANLLKNPLTYCIEAGPDNLHRLVPYDLPLPEDLMSVIGTALETHLARFDTLHGYPDELVLVHNDLGVQNVMVNPDGHMVIIDLENCRIANNPRLGMASDFAHLTTRLWYNRHWQREILDYQARKNASNPENQVAFLVNIILESLRRLTRPIDYYANGQDESGARVFAPEMSTFADARNSANFVLLHDAYNNLKKLVN